jgi:hypothetical protein
MLDKSKGLVLGSELRTATAVVSGAWTQTNGVVSAAGTAGSVSFTLSANTVAGRFYEVAIPNNVSGGSFYIDFGGSTGSQIGALGAATQRIILTCTAPGSVIRVGYWLGTPSGTIGPISVKELPGNHAVQATTANRPIYGIHPFGGRRNSLVRTEEFDNASWATAASGVAAPVRTANSGTAPNGTNTAAKIDFPAVSGTQGSVVQQTIGTGQPVVSRVGSVWLKATAAGDIGRTVFIYGNAGGGQTGVVLTGDWQRASIGAYSDSVVNFNIATLGSGLSGGLNQPAFSVLVWGAQLETGSTATAYQRVTDQYNVTEAGVSSVSYLFFDGVNDSLATPSINFTSTDKMTVFAGVRKLSDAARAIVAELGNGSVNLNQFILEAPSSALGDFAFRSVGSTGATAAATFASPTTRVLTGIGDIAGDNATLRVNGVQAAQNTSDQGSGTYGNFALNIGSRGGSGTFFSGHLYSLIVRGAQSNTGQISSTETWVAGKTGITI